MFILPPELQEIFGKQKLSFSEMPDILRNHLGTPDPVEIEYDIQYELYKLMKFLSIHFFFFPIDYLEIKQGILKLMNFRLLIINN